MTEITADEDMPVIAVWHESVLLQQVKEFPIRFVAVSEDKKTLLNQYVCPNKPIGSFRVLQHGIPLMFLQSHGLHYDFTLFSHFILYVFKNKLFYIGVNRGSYSNVNREVPQSFSRKNSCDL